MNKPRKIRRDRHLRQILRGSAVAFVLKVVGSVLSFGLSLILARYLGAEGAGGYFLAFTLVMVVASFSRLGMDTAVVRFAAISWEKRDRASLSYLLRTALTVLLVSTLVGATLLHWAAPLVATHVFDKPEVSGILSWMSFAVVSLSVVMLCSQMLKGVKRIRDSQLTEVILVPALTILGIYLLAEDYGVEGAAWSFLSATLIAAMFGLLVSQGLWRPQPADAPEVDRAKLMKTSLPLLGVTSVNMLTNAAAPLFLGGFGELADVAIYTMASKAAFLTSILLASVTSIAAPKFSTLYAQGKKAALERAVRKINLLLTLIALPILLAYLLFAEDIMSLFGAEFTHGYAALMILAVGQFVSVSSGSVGLLLIMSGHEKISLKIMTHISVANILLNLLLVPSMGFIGAAIATSLTLIGKNMYGILMARRLLGISVSYLVPLGGRK